jgi:hypothetical protein
MLTAFYVDNGKTLPLADRLPTAAYWLLPAAVAAPLIARSLHRYRGPELRCSSNRSASQPPPLTGTPSGRVPS